MIAEDELLVNHAARLELEDAGYTIFDAADGDEAVEVFMYNYDQIDLVLLDMTMPVMNSEILGSDAFYRSQNQSLALNRNRRRLGRAQRQRLLG